MKKKLLLAALLAPLFANAQPASFEQAVQQALISNPEVQARYRAWQAAREERSAASGGFFPRLDLAAGVTRERRRDPLVNGNYTQEVATVTLTQMLYDGFATKGEVARLGHAAVVRYLELRDTSENVTLEILRAYHDMTRFRTLVAMAEENYVRHRSLFDLIQERSQSGVGRRVDLETASGRLALAESNLLTEVSNLHDVTARFQRFTGTQPAANMPPVPSLQSKVPGDVRAALGAAIERSPALWAAYENVQVAKAAARTRNAAFHPRIEFQARGAYGDNVNGNLGNQNNHSAGLVLQWNLFNGGADAARTRQAAQLINNAQDVADIACRNLRQTISIAYNDTLRLTEQIRHLDQHQLATEKARDAYRQQFDIGQRTLLDLLDTENELFQARRAYTNAVADLAVAQARVAAGMGSLVSALGLVDQGADSAPQLSQPEGGSCDAVPTQIYTPDRSALNRRASELARESAARTPAAPPASAASQR